jgi:hypothetical protein
MSFLLTALAVAAAALAPGATDKPAARTLSRAAPEFSADGAPPNLPHGDSPLYTAIAVADDAQNRVMLFDAADGAYLDDFVGRTDALDSPFGCGAATLPFPPNDPGPALLVTDPRRRRVTAYNTSTRALIRVLIDNVTARGVAQMHTGDLLVAAGTAGVRRYKSDGTFVSTFALDIVDGPNNAWDILLVPTRDTDQFAWLALVADPTLDAVFLFDPNGVRLGVFAALPEFRHPEQLAQRSNGSVLLTDPIANAVFEFDAQGVHLRTFETTRPRGVIELDSGDLLIAGEAGVQVFNGSTGNLLATSMPGFPRTAPRYACRLAGIGDPP